MKIGAEVKKAREAMDLSQRDYGKLVGLPQQTISRIEAGSGVRSTTIDLLIRRGGLEWTQRGPKAKAA
jgi:transcriptional regulator with XRE-family HTH domain